MNRLPVIGSATANHHSRPFFKKQNENMSQHFEKENGGIMFHVPEIEAIAKVAQSAVKAWCEVNKDFTQPDWEDIHGEQRESYIKGVVFALKNPEAPNSTQHDAWMKDRIDSGWVYGEVTDKPNKIHSCLVPYEVLPMYQQIKDSIFKAIVNALK